jgi:hypothetical protein
VPSYSARRGVPGTVQRDGGQPPADSSSKRADNFDVCPCPLAPRTTSRLRLTAYNFLAGTKS